MQMLDIIKNKILDLETLGRWIAYWRFHSKKIVFTNGCFDILHLGHIDYLSKAHDAGDILIVGMNSDASTKLLKGKNRPVNNQESRSVLLASLHFVDAVVIFNEDTPYKLIQFIRPDVLVKGGDYKTEEIAGYDIVQKNGGKVITIDLLEGYSTSGIEARIRDEK